MKKYVFPARVVKRAKKNYTCFGCRRELPAGGSHITFTGKYNDGSFGTTRVCVECAFLMTQKTGTNSQNIREGEFTDTLIPNCLRKVREEFRRNAKEALQSKGLVPKNEGEDK